MRRAYLYIIALLLAPGSWDKRTSHLNTTGVDNTSTYAHAYDENSQQLQFKSEIIKKTYCSGSNLRLTEKLTLTNAGERALIIYKQAFKVSRSILNRDLKSAEKGISEKDFSRMMFYQINKMDDEVPPSELFLILKPRESHVIYIEDFIPVNDGDITHKEYFNPGEYYLRQEIITWGGPETLGKDLQKRWSPYGLLWLEPIVTEPTKLTIDYSPVIGDCDKD